MPLNNPFLKATPLYKEYAILELLSKNPNITQRAIAKELDSSLSMINQYLEDYEERKLIFREYVNGKQVKYNITSIGITRLRELNIIYLKNVRVIYSEAKDNILEILKNIINFKVKNIIMYGAGEVAKLTLMVILEEQDLPFNIVCVIDDDVNKLRETIMNVPIISLNEVNKFNYDAILISSYTHKNLIKRKLIEAKIEEDKIIQYF